MGRQIRIEFNPSGFRDVLFSEGVRNIVEQNAERIASIANASMGFDGQGFETKVWAAGFGGGRWAASVNAMDDKATAAETENKVLSKAVSECEL